MTAFVAATLHRLLLRRFRPQPAPPRHGADGSDAMPMLFRSEGFAEDLCESHPLSS